MVTTSLKISLKWIHSLLPKHSMQQLKMEDSIKSLYHKSGLANPFEGICPNCL
jgi:hypothetical protein